MFKKKQINGSKIPYTGNGTDYTNNSFGATKKFTVALSKTVKHCRQT